MILFMHEGAYLLAIHHLFEIAHDIHVEHIDGQMILLTHSGGREVHHPKIAIIDFIESDVLKLRGSGVLLRVGRHGQPLFHH